MKIFLPNLIKLSKNQVDTNIPGLAWAGNAAKPRSPSPWLNRPPHFCSPLFDNSPK
jgi:hypothetical protein